MIRNPFVRSRERRAGPTAFVLNVSPAGLGAIRNLGRASVPVIGLDPDPGHAGFASRYCTAKVCPHPVHEPDHLVEYLLREGRQLAEPGILSPASDAFALFVSRYRNELREYFRFNLPPPEVMEASVDKRKLYELAGQSGLCHATTFYPEHLDDVHRIKDELDYPVYIKPYFSHLWQVRFPDLGKGMKVLSPQELVSSFERIIPTGIQAMVQSIIVGPATNVRTVYMYVTKDGDLFAALTTRKIRQWPEDLGWGSMAESFHDPEVAELGTRFFHDINYRGFGTIEFKRDDRDGQLKVTDLNPRWVKPINLAIDSGIDFPLIHYLDLAGQTPAPPGPFKEGVRWLDIRRDVPSSRRSWQSGQLSPWAWARSWIGVRSFAALALDDLGPFFREYGYGRGLVRAPLAKWRRR